MRISDWSSDVCSSDLGRRGAVFLVYAVLLAATGLMFKAVPAGFIPTQDKLYLIAGVKLPEGASIARTDAMLSKVADIAMNTEGVAHSIAFPGLNALQFTNPPNTGVVRSEEHTSALQSLLRISYAVFCLTKNIHTCQLLLIHPPQNLQ